MACFAVGVSITPMRSISSGRGVAPVACERHDDQAFQPLFASVNWYRATSLSVPQSRFALIGPFDNSQSFTHVSINDNYLTNKKLVTPNNGWPCVYSCSSFVNDVGFKACIGLQSHAQPDDQSLVTFPFGGIRIRSDAHDIVRGIVNAKHQITVRLTRQAGGIGQR